MKWLQDWLTEADGTTPCVVRILATLGGFVGIGLAIYSVIFPEHKFDLQGYGIGLSALLLGVGGALKLKPEQP